MRYLDNASTTWPKPPAVTRAIEAALRMDPLASAEALDRAHASIAAHLGIPDPRRLWLTPGCTSALQVALPQLPWREGQTIVTSQLEHEALLRPVLRVAATHRVDHELLPYHAGAGVDLAQLEAILRARDVRWIAITAASNVTGERLDIAGIASLARTYGASLLVDAAQVAGVARLDLATYGADIVTFAGHKGPLGPHGIGGLWVAPHVAWLEGAATCTIEGAPSPAAGPSFCDVGSVNVAGAVGLAAGLSWLADHGDAWSVAHAAAVQLRTRLRADPEVRVFGDPAPAASNPTVSFVHLRLPLARAEAHFAAHGLLVRAGRHCAPAALDAIGSPEGTIRVSFGPFNAMADVDAICDALSAV